MNLNAEPNPVTLTSKTRLYRIWSAIKRRCYNPNAVDYKYYGGRGIMVCDEWRLSYKCFQEWALSAGYLDSLSIDRKDVNGNYEPSNCRWSTHKIQMNNFRRNRKITVDGVTMNVSEASLRYGIFDRTIIHRLNLGWTDEMAVKTKPVIGRNQSWKR